MSIAGDATDRAELGLAATLNARGLQCKNAAKYDEGRALYQRALALLEDERDPDQDSVATLYHNLGGIEHACGNYAAGEVFARRGLAIRRSLAGADPRDIAADLVALAAILDGQEKYAEAEDMYLEALGVFERRRAPMPGKSPWRSTISARSTRGGAGSSGRRSCSTAPPR